MKTLRKTAITIAMAAIACAVFTACGTGNDDGAVQPKEVVATKAVVTTTAETEAKTTTTTEPVEDSEPEITEETKTTTTTEVIETSEPETTTEATDHAVTRTDDSVPENNDELLSVEECLKQIVSKEAGEELEITNIDYDEASGRMTLYFDNGMVVGTRNVVNHYVAGDKTSINQYTVGRSTNFDYIITCRV